VPIRHFHRIEIQGRELLDDTSQLDDTPHDTRDGTRRRHSLEGSARVPGQALNNPSIRFYVTLRYTSR
jgi:hypothetical protein